jgi:hypothetical protein
MKENCYNDPAARCLIPIEDVFKSIWSSLPTDSRSMERVQKCYNNNTLMPILYHRYFMLQLIMVCTGLLT